MRSADELGEALEVGVLGVLEGGEDDGLGVGDGGAGGAHEVEAVSVIVLGA